MEKNEKNEKLLKKFKKMTTYIFCDQKYIDEIELKLPCSASLQVLQKKIQLEKVQLEKDSN